MGHKDKKKIGLYVLMSQNFDLIVIKRIKARPSGMKETILNFGRFKDTS